MMRTCDRPSRRGRPWRYSFLVALLVGVGGCGTPRCDVSGKVTYQGKTVVCGTITFVGSDGMPIVVPIQSDGAYQAKQVPVGPVQVAVLSLDPARPLKPWVMGIAVNRCRTWLTQRTRRPEPVDYLHDVAPGPPADDAAELAAEIKAALGELRLEYRSVFVLFHERLDRMLTEDAPAFANWDQDVTAVERRYDLADPAEVARELVATGAVIADRFDAVAGDQWERTGTRSDGATFTVESFARYFLHDPVHHVHDVRSGFERLSAR